MDTHQVPSGPKKGPSKKKKHRTPTVEQPKSSDQTSLSQNTGSLTSLISSTPEQQPQHIKTECSQASVDTCSVSPEESLSKRKRIRKKKSKKQPLHENEDSKHVEDEYEADAVVNISTTLLPAVHKAIHLLQTSGEHMNDQSSNTSQTSSKKSTKNLNRKKATSNNCEEVEKVVSPGAQKLSLELSRSAPLQEQAKGQKAEHWKLSVSNVLNSQDLDLLKSAHSIGPIYSRPSFCASVTVTSSSASSQLSSDRIQNLHLFGSSPQSSSCETPSSTVASLPDKMSAPQALQKSREEVEVERKARKAAKSAAKGKGKPAVQEASQTNTDKGKETIPGNNIVEGSKGGHEPNKSLSKIETLTDGIKHLTVSESKIKSKGKAVDEPDLAISVNRFLPHQKDVLSAEVAKKSKAELRAEGRAKQEAQRAAKAQQQLEKSKPQPQKSQPTVIPDKVSIPDIKQKGKVSTTTKPMKEVKDSKAERRVKLFSHLYQNSFKKISETVGVSHPQYHSSIVRLGVQYANRVVLGSNARCLALLYALKEVVKDYETPPQKEFSRGLEAYMQPNMDLLQQCRPHSVSMVNALRYIKWQLTQIPIGDSDNKAKQHILDAIDQYIDDQIGKAAEAIGKVVKDKIDDNDVILVYACSSLVLSALKVALDEKRKFHVIVVDSLPWLEGREMLRRLVAMGVQCSYVHLSAASFVMRQVSKVLLGAHALLANGYVMSRAGSSQIALMAHAYNVPVLVCCETHKFSERVQTDSFVYNELGNPDELISSKRAGEREAEQESIAVNWRDIPSLSLLNLVYDVTPPDLVTAVVTERAILPCTSVPVILRIKPTEC